METTDSTFDFLGGEFAQDTAAPVYAGFWLRVAAAIIDWVVLMIPNWILSMVLAGGIVYSDMADLSNNPAAIFAMMSSYLMTSALISILYKAIMESSSWQATLGKKAVDLKVTTETGARLSFLRALGRTLASYISGFIMGIGYLMAAFTSKKQALHDLIASTLVVKRRA